MRDLLKNLRSRENCESEWMEDFANLLPMRVVLELLGFDDAGATQLKASTAELGTKLLENSS